jgi:hypothetical protein
METGVLSLIDHAHAADLIDNSAMRDGLPDQLADMLGVFSANPNSEDAEIFPTRLDISVHHSVP